MFGEVSDALLVELEGVVGERPAEEVLPDVGAASAEPSFGDERVGRLKMGGGEPMSRLSSHLSPRHSGSV